MNPLLDAMPRHLRRLGLAGGRNRAAHRKARRQQLSLRRLEDRTVPSSFNFTDFSNVSSLNLQGAAASVSNRLRLTPSQSGLSGSAWYNVQKPLVEATFQTTFQFQLSDGHDGDPANGGSDGFTFAIQNTDPTALGPAGGGLGYEGLQNSVVIEFDTYLNDRGVPAYNDSSASSISVHTNGTGPNFTSEAYSLGHYDTSGFILDDGQVHTAKVSYTPGTLSIYLDNLTTPVLTVSVTLPTKLNLDGGHAWVGFTAATGGGYENHDILNWSLQADDNVIFADTPAVVEGAAGTTTAANFTITRVGSLAGPAVVNWSTANGTATAASDYVAASGQVTFADGESQKAVSITVNGDATSEPNETFKLALSTTASYTTAPGLATILNDDASISIGSATATEGDTSITPLRALVSWGLGGPTTPATMIIGTDGALYVASRGNNGVYRYDAATGLPLPALGKPGAEFVTPGDGGLSGPRDIAFGPFGYLYVVSENTDSVLRYRPDNGNFDSTFIAPGAGGLDAPRGLLFNGSYAYVTSVGGTTAAPGMDSVLRFDAGTGAPAGVGGDAVFIASGSGGLDNPSRIVFGPDGNAYVSSSSSTSNAILRYNGSNGQFMDAFVPSGSGGLNGPVAMVFRPDGYLYVTGNRSNAVFRYQSSNGAFAGLLVPGSYGGLNALYDLLFEPGGNVLVTSMNTNQVLRFGTASQLMFTVSLAQPSVLTTTVSYSTIAGSAQAGSDYVAVTSGTVGFAPAETTKTILIQTLDNSTGEPSETFAVSLSNPVGGSITTGQGTGTILDDDGPAKFYVVNDAIAPTGYTSTFKYQASGALNESYNLDFSNTDPVGAAANAAGTKVWVLNGNGTVYVYDTNGGLLGSWTAGGGLISPQGITVWNNDLWIVDREGSGTVYKYTGAATRLSGSQNPASSFTLATGPHGNSNAMGIVTDGTYFWVVNDGLINEKDRVFKYSLSGASKGNWVIDAANSHPTGLTINPNSPSDIWVVDSGTKSVYKYANAAGKTSGSQSAAAVFALAAGNTNPQDIADPPVQDMPITPAGTALPFSLPPTRNVSVPISPEQTALAHLTSLASRDALFALLAPGFLLDGATPSAHPAGPRAQTPDTVSVVDHSLGLTPGRSAMTVPAPTVSDLLDLMATNTNAPAAAMMNVLFAHAADNLWALL